MDDAFEQDPTNDSDRGRGFSYIRPHAGQRILKREIRSAREEAEQILLDAQNEAQKIIASAEAVREEAAQDGMRQAYDEGQDRWQSVVAELQSARDALLTQSQGELAQLATEIAEQLVCEHLQMRPEAIEAIVLDAISRLRDHAHLKVRVHPDAARLLRGEEEPQPQSLEGVEDKMRAQDGVEIVADASLRVGDCIVETVSGAIDARIETKLNAMREGFSES